MWLHVVTTALSTSCPRQLVLLQRNGASIM
jgi:hypothetical protein